MTTLQNKAVVVTGAGSGIGRALALALLRRGARVAASDVNSEGLDETRSLADGAEKLSVHTLDVRDPEAMTRHAAQVIDEHGGADVIINNAGLASRASIQDMSLEDFRSVIDVNLYGVVHGTRAFLPHFQRQGSGHVVNISSINAFVPFAKNGPYNAAKAAVLGFSETLMQELADGPIRVTCVHPGGIQTNIVRNAKGATEAEARFFQKIARTTPEQAAARILRGIERDERRVYIGGDAHLMAAAKRLLPAWTVDLVGRLSLNPLAGRARA